MERFDVIMIVPKIVRLFKVVTCAGLVLIGFCVTYW